MSLVELKKKINSIFTIYKTTKAMRSIALSYHTQLKKKIQQTQNTLNLLNSYYCSLIKETTTPTTRNSKCLHIFIGSERGLCGAYNQKVKNHYNKIFFHKEDFIIVIGKKIQTIKLKDSNNHLLLNRTPNIDYTILSVIKEHQIETVHLYGIKAKNLFTHLFTEEAIFISDTKIHIRELPEYLFLGNHPETTIEKIKQKILLLKIDLFLQESLAGEHAMRFFSMENASKNAEKNYAEKRKEYFKKRQTKINQELSILS